MVTNEMIYKQSDMAFFCAQQTETYRNVYFIPAPANVLNDLQQMYWMGGEL